MNEKLGLFNIKDQEYYPIIKRICEQLGIEIIFITEADINYSVGYILGIDGYSETKVDDGGSLLEPMILFAGFNDEQLDIILQLFKEAGVPYIPLKAVLTQVNVEWSFSKLHNNVNQEYLTIKNMHSKN